MSATQDTVEMVAAMLTVEIEAPVAPIDGLCGWCGIRLRAIPDPPKPYLRRDETEVLYFHPTGCLSAQRNKDAGISGRVDSLVTGGLPTLR
jgi:hypothetical protein